MTPLALGAISSVLAQASRALGAGVTLNFQARGHDGELKLLPMLPNAPSRAGTWLHTNVGPLCLGDAGAVLSLLGELPVTCEGDDQPWYWQLISQRLSQGVAGALGAISPLDGDAPAVALLHAQLHVRLGDERVQAQLAAPPQTWLNWLQAPEWQRIRTALHEALVMHIPLQLGQLELSAEQLASLQPGDIVLPAQASFTCDGSGHLALASRYWAAQVSSRGEKLFLNLRHEESSQHEH